MKISSINFIGSGNVATNLAIRFFDAGIVVNSVWSRNLQNSQELAEHINAKAVESLEELTEADLTIISIADHALGMILGDLNINQKVVHTSGTIPLNEFIRFDKSGVFYPLQTLKKNDINRSAEIPILIESDDKEFQQSLIELAKCITAKTAVLDSDQRKKLHVAAVMVNNFANQLFVEASTVCNEFELDFNLLKPLIEETSRKAIVHNPISVQTGPAKRNDQLVMEEHLKILANHPEIQQIYRLISERIVKTHHEL